MAQSTDYRAALHNNTITMHSVDHHKKIFDVKDYTKRPKVDRTYYWYQTRDIHVSQGGYSGKVLHGSYQEYYPNHNLLSVGNFRHGSKTGKWTEWNSAGKLQKQSHWKRGRESGRYMLFDSLGFMVEHGRLRSGMRHGKVLIFGESDSLNYERYYHDGVEISKDHYRQQNLFRRTVYYLEKKWEKVFHRSAQ